MRKKSSYRPRPIIRDTVAWITEGFAPVTSRTDDNVRLRLRNHLAFDSVMHGDATAGDLDALIAASNMTTALSRKFGGDTYGEEIRASADAIESMQRRFYTWKKVQATPSELEAVRLMLRIHDAQLDLARVADIEESVRIVRKGLAA